jgi:UPF0271 protein
MTDTADGLVIDLNSDLGEGFGIWTLGDDDALLDIVTSANVACGFHAGDPTIMRRVCERAAGRGVAIGAQVSYQDLPGFGRRSIDMDAERLADDVTYQIGALEAFCRQAGTRVSYVKPHGALYNRCVHDEVQAGAVVSAVRRYDPGLPVLALPGSRLLALAGEAGLPAVPEAFADRAYTPQATLLPRTQPGAVLHDPDEIAARAVRIAAGAAITAHDGSPITVSARSVCVHGDTPGAAAIAATVRARLTDSGIRLAPFAPSPGTR